jgi:hypothetical protein
LTEWWHQNWGNIASAIGVVISVFALWRAHGASRAAKRALATQYQRTLAQELRSCSEKVGNVARLCRSSDWPRAREETDEVVQRITVAQHGWKDQLVDNVSRNELNLVVEHLGFVSSQIARQASGENVESPRETLDRALNLAVRKLAAEVGKHERAVDGLT